MAQHPKARPVPSWLILAIFGKIHFANCGRLKEIFRAINHDLGLYEETNDDCVIRNVCFDLRGVPSFDSSSVEVMLEVVQEYRKTGLKICIIRNGASHLHKLVHLAQLEKIVGSDNIFSTMTEAVVQH